MIGSVPMNFPPPAPEGSTLWWFLSQIENWRLHYHLPGLSCDCWQARGVYKCQSTGLHRGSDWGFAKCWLKSDRFMSEGPRSRTRVSYQVAILQLVWVNAGSDCVALLCTSDVLLSESYNFSSATTTCSLLLCFKPFFLRIPRTYDHGDRVCVWTCCCHRGDKV